MPVQVFNSMQNNAPELNGNSASLITVLDAVLVNGYNTLSVSSITRSGSTATVTTSTAHDFVTNDSVAISGATETEYNRQVSYHAHGFNYLYLHRHWHAKYTGYRHNNVQTRFGRL